VLHCRCESDIPGASLDRAVETDQLDQSTEVKEVRSTSSEEEQPRVDIDHTTGVENTSFSVDELTVRLRKSLTLDDQIQPQNELLAAVEQGAELESDASEILSEDHPANESCTFFDCENKSFVVEDVLPNSVVEPAQDIVDNQPAEQSEVNVPKAEQVGEADEKLDSDSAELAEKMADLPSSPPIAVTKGSYTINWDEIDENSDPSMSKKRLSNSPLKSPVLPARVGAGDGNSVGEVDAFKPSHRLADSPPGATAADEGSAVKPTQRRSVNNNLPEPVADVVVREPVADNTVSQPVADGSVFEPVADSIVSEPVSDSMVSEPVSDSFVSEPITDSTVSEPVADNTVSQPVVDDIVSEPVADSIVSESVTDNTVSQPVADDIVSEPVTDNTVSQPVADDIVFEPVADNTVCQPVAESIVSEPVTDSTGLKTVTNPDSADSIVQSHATDTASLESDNKTSSTDDYKHSESVQGESATK